MHAVIVWSWEPLGANARPVAERISTLSGGVTPDPATAVCGATAVAPSDIPELLAGLVDRSLLQLAPDTGPYRMLEIREYSLGADQPHMSYRPAAHPVPNLAGQYTPR